MDLLGARIGQEQVLLDEGSRREVSFRAPRPIEIMQKHCGEQVDVRSRGVLRITLIDSVTARPISGASLWLTSKNESRLSYAARSDTDASGAAVFCEVPPGQPLVISSAARSGRALLEITMNRGSLAGRLIRTTQP